MTTSGSPLPKRDRSVDQEQLLQLFWNRAELKKEFDKLRAESRNLSDQVRKQEALTLRVQQRLEQLETQLGSPETAARAVTYYHLRAVWHRCHGVLLSCSKDLVRVHREREQREHIAAFHRELNESLTAVQREANKVGRAAEVLSAEIRQLRDQRSACRGLWKLFARRRLTAAINGYREQRRDTTFQLGKLAAELTARAAEPPPPFPGLSVAARRSVNLVLVAMAQELYLLFLPDRIAPLAREAQARAPADVSYGDRRDCRFLRRHVAERVQVLEADATLRTRAQARARRLRDQIEYRGERDTVPVAGMLDVIERFRGDGERSGKVDVNVLSEEYWDLFSVLLS